jgi:tetratricopeptide (TPR) repeat protein
MSPEQLGGDPAAVDLRADVYALGVVGYELLAGKLPIPIEGERLPEAARRIAEEVPPPLGAVDRALRGDLSTIFAKALEMVRERRYATAGRLADDLGRYLRHEPIEARDPSTIYQLSRFARRNRVLVGGVAAVFLALVGGIVATTRQARRADEERKGALLAKADAEREQGRAEAAERAARRSTARLEQANQMTMDVFGMAQPDKKGRNVLLLDALRAQAESIASNQGLDPEIEAIHLHSIGSSFAESGLEAEAEPLLRRALERARTALGSGDPFTVLVADDLSETLRFLGRAPEAVTILRGALADLESSKANGAVDLAPAYGKTRRLLGGCLLDSGNLEEGAAILRALYAERLEHHEPLDDVTVTCASNLGAALLYKGKFDDALLFLSEVDEWFRAGGGAVDTHVLAMRANLASAYRRVGLYEESEKLAVAVLAAYEATSGADHPEALSTAQGLARLYQVEGKLDLAVELDRRTLEMLEKKQGYLGPATMLTVVRWLVSLDQLGERAELESGLTRMCTALAELPRLERDEHLNALKLLADLDLRWRNLAEAVPIAEEVVGEGERILSPGHPNLARYRETLASCRLQQRRFDESEQLLRTCREFYVGTQGPAGPDTQRIDANLARVASARVAGR